METMNRLADDATVVQRILDHIDHHTTDVGARTLREPVENYRSEARFAAERRVLRRWPVPFCPSLALPDAGSYVAREAAGTPLVAVRGRDGVARVFRNACRHRGSAVAAGAGCEKSFMCRYHGWTYDLDGRLRHVPHEEGFPGLDKSTRGLVAVEASEHQGLVFVTQEVVTPETLTRETGAPGDAELDALPPIVPAGYRLAGFVEQDMQANWKIVVESFLEGYHIRTTHEDTFYPVQFDNLNVVESFGANSRIAFPFRAIHRQRAVAPAERTTDGTLTFVYHLFPNVLVATFPGRIIVVALEPVALDRTRFYTWQLTNQDPDDAGAQATLQRGGDLVNAGAAQDRDVVCAIQRSLGSGANEFFEFGLFEAAIVHFHTTLRAALDGVG
jgi:phenylpropionate dioxygenase-like ring-hydroxylating dioxygenase large terminal subunit